LRANMKSLRVLAGIKTDIVYHVGRHSFATTIELLFILLIFNQLQSVF